MTAGSGGDRSLFDRAGRALGWSFASTAIGRLSTVAITVALARLLGPADFGTFAVATVALLAVLSFNELGVSLAIVRWPGDPRDIVPTVASLSVLSSTLVYAGCYAGAPLFADLMGEPAATPVVRLLSLSVVVSGLVAAPVALLQRSFRQDRKLIADQVTTWVSALTSIGCVLAGLGAMSLAIGQLAGASVGAVLFIAFEPAGVRIGFDPTRATALLRFGLPLAGSSVVVFAVANVDRLIVGAVLGPVPLGVYVLAVNLSNWPVVMFSQPVRSVAPAMLARLQGEPPALRAALLSCARLLAATSLPACAALAGAAGPVIRLVYGAPWAGAADVLPWLAVLAGLRILFELCYDFFVVLARTRVVFTAQLVWLIALVPSVWAGVHLFGVAGAAALQVVVACVLVLPVYVVQLHGYGIGAGLLMSRLTPPAIVAALVTALAWLASRLPGGQLPGLAISGLACGGAVVLLLHRMRSDLQALRGTGVVDTRTATDRGDPVPAPRPPSQAFEVVASGPLPPSAEPAPVVTARPPGVGRPPARRCTAEVSGLVARRARGPG